MNIVIINRFGWDWSKEIGTIQDEFPDSKIYLDPQPADEHLALAEVIIAHQFSKDQLAKAGALKCLLVPFTGLNLFPLKELKMRAILTANSHGNGAIVAEHAITLALALTHNVMKRHSDLKDGIWNRSFTQKDYWTALTGLRCTVLGTGEVGGHVARLLKAFDCSVKGFRRAGNGGQVPDFDMIVTDLGSAFSDTDLLFVCLPLTKETTGLIGLELLRKLSGGFIVNVARGEIIKEEDLYIALKDNILAGAGIDVWYNYPSAKNPEPVLPSKFPIHELPNVVMSPHVATHSKKARDLDKEATLKNLLAFLRTGRPVNVVDLDRAY